MTLRFSSELPDDEGTVFVAYLPGVAFIVTGPRDERTGELCVGHIGYPPPGMNVVEVLANAAPGSEKVTGPEAARLIIEIERWLAARAGGG